MHSYYLSILGIGVANLALAAVAYAQRAKQIRGNALREQQVALAETRNELAERRLQCLDNQLALLGQIRDVLCADPEQPIVIVADRDGHLSGRRSTAPELRSVSPSTGGPPAAA